MLAFAHPAFLWGLLAIGVPILVHLLNQRRPRPLRFGAIEFVLRSQRQKARRLRLRQLLLLALRCLLLAAIAVALARPSLSPRGAARARAQGPQATALVLDASLSMRYRTGGTTLFARARADALDALDRLSPDEPATVVACEGPPGAAAAPSFDRAAARRALEAQEPSFLAADLTACLAQAARALGESPVPGKRVLVFTDLAAHALRLDQPAPELPAAPGAPRLRPNVVFVDAARGRELPNAALIGTEVRPSPQLGPRGYEIAATVANFSAEALSGAAVSLRVSGQVLAKGFVDVPARGTAKKILAAVLPAGRVAGRAELSRTEAGGLDEDDGQDFVVQVPKDLRVLIVDGGPSSLRARDEAFFVEVALSPARTAGRMQTQTLDADAAARASLEPFDAILLLDLPAPGRPFVERLRQAVAGRGAGLFIALGEHVEPDAYNEAFGDLLPRPLHVLKTAQEPGAESAAGGDRSARFGSVDWASPPFRVFGPADRESLEATLTSRYALLKPAPGSTAHTLVAFDDGAPALLEGRAGKGRVLLLTTSASHAWTDWPTRTSFLPVLQQSVAWLAGALDEKQPAVSQVGATRALVAPAGTSLAQVVDPEGRPLPLRREAPQAADAVAGPLLRPGVHRVQVVGRDGAPRDEPELGFAAVLDPRESDLRRLDPAEIRAWLGGESQVAASAEAAAGQRGTPLWPALLLLAALAVAGEGALTRR